MKRHNFKVVAVCTKCGEVKKYDADIVVIITIDHSMEELSIEAIGGHDMPDEEFKKILTEDIPDVVKDAGLREDPGTYRG